MLKQTNNKNMTCHKDYKICKIGKGLLWAGTFQRRKCASQKKGSARVKKMDALIIEGEKS